MQQRIPKQRLFCHEYLPDCLRSLAAALGLFASNATRGVSRFLQVTQHRSHKCACADDAMAILSAFNWPEVKVVGITTLFGNVPTEMATENALILRNIAAEASPSGTIDSCSQLESMAHQDMCACAHHGVYKDRQGIGLVACVMHWT
jgi:hypothetical protein